MFPLEKPESDPADVRFILATNKDLEQEIIEGRFRYDLFYRINVISIPIPPLRERPEDIPLLANFFLEKYSKTVGKKIRKISSYALKILSEYHFPGNVRELENIIERSVAMERSTIILPESLVLAHYKGQPPPGNSPYDPPCGRSGSGSNLGFPGKKSYPSSLETALGNKQRTANL